MTAGRAVLVAVLAWRVAFAQPAATVTYAGRIVQGGKPLAGEHVLILRVCTSDEEECNCAAGGSGCLWEELHSADLSAGGTFAVALGDGVIPLAPALDGDGARWLEIAVDGAPLGPRTRIRSVPFALRAQVAETAAAADGLAEETADDYSAAGHAHPFACPAGQVALAITAEGALCGARSVAEILTGSGLANLGTVADPVLALDFVAIGDCAAGEKALGFQPGSGALWCVDDADSGFLTGVVAGAGVVAVEEDGVVTLSADTTVVQARTALACPAGAYVRGVLAAGALDCAAPIAGPGVVVAENQIALDFAMAGGDAGSAAEAARADHGHDARHPLRSAVESMIVMAMGPCPEGWEEMPQTRDRFVRGWDGAAAGATGGVDSHAHSYADVTAHAHTFDPPSAGASADGWHGHNITTNQDDWNCGSGGRSWCAVRAGQWNRGGGGVNRGTDGGGTHAHTLDLGPVASSTVGVASAQTSTDANLPPYTTVAFCRRTAP